VLIILEGNELNFKTTIAKKLSILSGFNTIKGSSFEQSKASNDELFTRFSSMSKMNKTIIDRFIYSNLVYASLYKDFSMINEVQRLHLEEQLRDNNALVIYLHSDVEVLKQRLKVRGDEYVHEDKLQSINERYAEVLKNSTVPVLYINTEHLSSDKIAEYIYTLIRKGVE